MKTSLFKRCSYLILIYIFLIIVSIVIIYPFIWMILTSFKLSEDAIFSRNISAIFMLRNTGLGNYRALAGISCPPLWKMVLNSITTALGATIINSIVCFFAAYMLAKHKIVGGKFLLFFFISMMIIPQQVIAVPLYLVLNSLNEIFKI